MSGKKSIRPQNGSHPMTDVRDGDVEEKREGNWILGGDDSNQFVFV